MRPGRRFWLKPVQLDGAVVILEGFFEFAEVIEAQPQSVVRAHHVWIQLDNLLQAGDGRSIVLRIVVQPSEPIGVERIARLGSGKLLEFRTGPIAVAELDVRHGKGKTAALIEWSDGFGPFPGNGGIQVLAVEKEDSGGRDQQFGRSG